MRLPAPDRDLTDDERAVLIGLTDRMRALLTHFEQIRSVVSHEAVKDVETDEQMSDLATRSTPESQRYRARLTDLENATHYLRLAAFFAGEALIG